MDLSVLLKPSARRRRTVKWTNAWIRVNTLRAPETLPTMAASRHAIASRTPERHHLAGLRLTAVIGPSVHQSAPLLEEVAPAVGTLDLVLNRMS